MHACWLRSFGYYLQGARYIELFMDDFVYFPEGSGPYSIAENILVVQVCMAFPNNVLSVQFEFSLRLPMDCCWFALAQISLDLLS